MKLTEKSLFEILDDAPLRQLDQTSMIVGWAEDAGHLGSNVIDYLCRKLPATRFAQVNLAPFFPLTGVAVEDDIVQFPETAFYICPEKKLVLFKAGSPRTEWHNFLDTIVDVGKDFCHIRDIYTIGGIVSLSAHTAPRDLLAVASSPQTRLLLEEYDIASDMTYETPPTQRPTLNSYLLWVARNRQIPAVSLWVPTPFYLTSWIDPQAWKKIIEFFISRFDLEIDLHDIDVEIDEQNQKINRLISRVPEIEHYIWKLGRNLALTEDESQRLVKEIEEEMGRS